MISGKIPNTVKNNQVENEDNNYNNNVRFSIESSKSGGGTTIQSTKNPF